MHANQKMTTSKHYEMPDDGRCLNHCKSWIFIKDHMENIIDCLLIAKPVQSESVRSSQELFTFMSSTQTTSDVRSGGVCIAIVSPCDVWNDHLLLWGDGSLVLTLYPSLGIESKVLFQIFHLFGVLLWTSSHCIRYIKFRFLYAIVTNGSLYNMES